MLKKNERVVKQLTAGSKHGQSMKTKVIKTGHYPISLGLHGINKLSIDCLSKRKHKTSVRKCKANQVKTFNKKIYLTKGIEKYLISG